MSRGFSNIYLGSDRDLDHFYMVRSCSKYWVFTLNNYTDAELVNCKGLFSKPEKKVSYLVIGLERGDSGTPHIQGYVEFLTRSTAATVRDTLGGRAHIELRRGSGAEAANYCKKDGTFFEYGTIFVGNRGKRTDLERIKERIKAGASDLDIAEEFFSPWCQYRRAFTAYRSLLSPPIARPNLEVYCLWGAPGCGKTRFATEYATNRKLDFWMSSDPELRWFDGYAGERVAILDDFRGDAPAATILRVLDIYPTRAAIKGGYVSWNPVEIWVTSNKDPREWYGDTDVTAAIRRRFTRVIHFPGFISGEWENEYIRIRLNL